MTFERQNVLINELAVSRLAGAVDGQLYVPSP